MKDELTTDNLVLKFGGKVEVPMRLEIGTNYVISIKGSITAITEEDRFDGGRIMIYKFEPVLVDLITEMGKTIKLKDPRRNSQKIRSWLFKIYADEGYVQAFDDVYDAATLEICSLMPSILRSAIKRLTN